VFATKAETMRSAGISVTLFGGLLLFCSLAIIVADPENGRSAFPFPFGLPGIVMMAIGIAIYLLAGGVQSVKNA
jgi:hypothetical protein